MLVIRLQTPNDPDPAWAVLDNKPADWRHGSWETLLPAARGQDVVLLIPSREVLLTQTSVNTRNQRQLQQAVPFALEDSIADDLDNQHIVWQTRPDSSLVDVAIIRRERLREWVSALQDHQLRAHSYPARPVRPAVGSRHHHPVATRRTYLGQNRRTRRLCQHPHTPCRCYSIA